MQQKKITKAEVLKKIHAFFKNKIVSYNQKVERNPLLNSRGAVANKINNQSIIMEFGMWAVNRKFGKKKFFDTRTFLAKKFDKSLPTIDTLLDKLRCIGFKIERGLNKFSTQILNCMKFEFADEIIELFELCAKGETPTLTPIEPKQEQQQKDLASELALKLRMWKK